MTNPKRILLLGASGTIGRATAKALTDHGHEVVCFLRPHSKPDLPAAVVLRFGEVTDPRSLQDEGFKDDRFDAIVSCLASRTGAPRDAWAIDHRANLTALEIGQARGVGQMVLLSAICVQKPTLAFQQAKLAFEKALVDSGITYSIVRPTAFFKSLSGQINRLKAGKPFLVFGTGDQTACKPISDGDLGDYLARCLTDPQLQNRVLPIGGPGPAITPRQQGEHLFALLGRPAKFRSVPLGVMDGLVAVLSGFGRLSSRMADKAELARIGRYYATESMLVLDPATGHYDAGATPSTGAQTLFDHYAKLIREDIADDRGDHAVF